MEEWNSGIDQLTKPIGDALLHVPRETLKAGKELATEAPRKVLKTITNISLNIVRFPLTLLMNIPFLPGPVNPDGSQDMLSLGEARSRVRDITALSQQGKLFDVKSIKRILNAGKEDEIAQGA